VGVLRVVFATVRLGLWFLRRLLFGGGKPQRGKPSLPSPFQSVASEAFHAGQHGGREGSKPLSRCGKLRRVKLRYRAAFGLLAGGILGISVTFAVMVIYFTVVFPNPLAIRNGDHAPVVRVLARDGTLIAERGSAREHVSIESLPKLIPAAIVATEDRRFFDHYGLDPAGMIRAMFANLRAGRFAQGGSTLTQQLAKNLFLTSDRTLSRKIAELGLALWLEIRLSKPEILELYLNQVYFGGGAYGIEAASQRYFGKPARDLTLSEAAIIAGLLKAPSKYSPATNPGAARARGRVVIERMLDAGFISQQDADRALQQTVVFNDPKEPKADADSGYVVDYVLEQLPSLIGSGYAEVTVETTLDKNLQRRAEEIVAQSLAKRGQALGATQAAVVVVDGEGGIRALVGGRDYTESQFNRAVKAKRQPGSSFKPFVYLAALERGMTPESAIVDQPITIGGWSPKNDNGTYQGEISLRQALAQSVNTVAARLNQQVGSGRAVEVAERFGIKSELHEGPSLALGTSEVTLLEMAGAYASFSNGGAAVEPHIISRVRSGADHVLFEGPLPHGERIAEIGNIGALNDMLNAAVVYGTGRRAALPDHPAAGKTGTTQDFRDAWFIGYTSYLTAGVWVGNDNGKPMNRATGGSLPAEIWNQVMRVAHLGKPPMALPGTVMSGPVDETADAEGNPLVLASTGLHAPRVVYVREELPWARRPAPAARHPTERIGEDFITQALSGTLHGTRLEPAASVPEPSGRARGTVPFLDWW